MGAASEHLTAARWATPGRTFVDDEHQRRFEVEGYAVVPVLDADEVAALRRAYRDLRPATDHGLAIDYVRPEREYMVAVAELTAPIWARVLPRLFVDHQVVMTTFVTKHPGPASAMFLHDDRSFVDERVHRAGTLWVPLVDVGPDLPNGGLQVIPGSHLLPEAFSGSNTPDLFRPYEADLRRALVTPEVPAGHAIFYDTRTLHASPPNLGDESREAVVCAVVPAGAPPVHLLATGRRRRELYAVDVPFFLHHHPREIEQAMPSSTSLLEAWDEDVRLEPEEVGRFLGIDPAPVPVPVVPDDLAAPPGGAPPSPGRWPSAAAVRDHDLDLAADALAEPEAVPSPVRYRSLAGRAGVAPADQPRWRRGQGVELAGELGLVVRTGRGRWCDVVVVDPGGRLELEVPQEGAGAVELDVTESPVQGAGLGAGGRWHQLDPGDSWVLAGGTTALVWNQGPGPLALALGGEGAPEPAERRAVADRAWAEVSARRSRTSAGGPAGR